MFRVSDKFQIRPIQVSAEPSSKAPSIENVCRTASRSGAYSCGKPETQIIERALFTFSLAICFHAKYLSKFFLRDTADINLTHFQSPSRCHPSRRLLNRFKSVFRSPPLDLVPLLQKILVKPGSTSIQSAHAQAWGAALQHSGTAAIVELVTFCASRTCPRHLAGRGRRLCNGKLSCTGLKIPKFFAGFH